MRLIDADRLLSERMMAMYYHLPNGDVAIPIIDIEHAPTVSAHHERKTGEWILKPHEKMLAWDCEPFGYDETYDPKHHSVIEMLYHCSTCDYEVGDTKPIWKFCPMCGTDMREVDE